ncbi:MAG: hypothetical protein JWP91_1700 [Fibrobacteres bacterium]|nr:hypothetical protein [Fibrobacterota bacterium]
MSGKNVQGILEDLSAKFDKVLATSELVAGLRRLTQTDRRLSSGRPLSYGERLCLESQGNICADWARVRIESDAGMETIRNNWFEGDVLIAGFRGEWKGPDGRAWPAGMANCRVLDAVIGNACLYHIARLERQVIEDGAVLVGLGEIDCPSPTLFSLGTAIHPGTEAGTRSVWIWDSLTLDDCMDAISLTADAQKTFQQKLDAVLAPLRSRFGYVGKGAAVSHARHIHSSFIGPGTLITGASLIREAAFLSTPDERCVVAEEAWIEHSLLQPGARVESSGKVSSSVLLEHSSVAWGGMVFQSVVGPNTQVNKGEMSTSIVGPFVGFHHQSLLISAIWPEGRGNIAYGANVGSNHTGKKPDQEIRPGEGNFFGLGCSIKFPANYEDSPYSIIATGVSTLPQRLAFPFSLINQPLSSFPELGPAINEIVPGWMWSDNSYSLVRRSYKFEGSNEARRHDFTMDKTSSWKTGFFAGRIFASALARKVLKARQSLRAAPADRPYHLESEIPGLGKNFVRNKVRERAVAAYEDYLVFFLMRTFTDRPQEAWDPQLHELIAAIAKELSIGADTKAYLAAQRSRLPVLRDNILTSLQRDDKRGRQIFDDYGDFHSPPEEDAAIARLDKDLKELGQRLETFLKPR